MPFNGSGVFSRAYSWVTDAANGLKISSSRMDADTNDIANGLTNALCKDGQSTPTANIKMGAFKFTNLGAGSARTDSAAISNLQDGTGIWAGTAGGTGDAITLTPAVPITAYVTGMLFRFVASAANTVTTPTINVSGVSAVTIRSNNIALTAGQIVSGQLYEIIYDGTYFQLIDAGAAYPALSGMWSGTAGGSADALTLTPSPAISAYVTGQVFRFKAGASPNATTTPTVNVSGVGAKTIQKNGSALAAGDIAANGYYSIQYDGTNFQISAWNLAAASIAPSGISFSTTQRVAGRNTAGAGAGEEVTFSQFLDWVGSAAQGDILYRDASSWARLAAGTSGNYLKTQGAGANPTWAAVSAGFTVATKQATTSGTAFDFTGIPSTAKLIMVLFNGVSLSGTDNLLVQIGPSGGIETTSYTSASGDVVNNVSSTSGFVIRQGNAANAWSGIMFIALLEASSNTWIANLGGATNLATGGGTKALAGTLDRVRLTRTGTDTFDAGSVTVSYI